MRVRCLWSSLLSISMAMLCACPPQKESAAPPPPPPPPAATLTGVSPRTLSNATAQPLLVFGSGFTASMHLRLGAPFGLEIPLIADDATHAHAKLPATLTLDPETSEATAP